MYLSNEWLTPWTPGMVSHRWVIDISNVTCRYLTVPILLFTKATKHRVTEVKNVGKLRGSFLGNVSTCILREIFVIWRKFTLFVYENSDGIVEIWLLSWEVNISPSLGESLRVSCYICLAQKYKWKLPEMLVTLYIWSKIQTVEHFCNRRVCNFMKEICHRFDCGVRYCTHFKCTMIDYSVNGVRYSIGKCITVIISQYD